MQGREEPRSPSPLGGDLPGTSKVAPGVMRLAGGPLGDGRTHPLSADVCGLHRKDETEQTMEAHPSRGERSRESGRWSFSMSRSSHKSTRCMMFFCGDGAPLVQDNEGYPPRGRMKAPFNGVAFVGGCECKSGGPAGGRPGQVHCCTRAGNCSGTTYWAGSGSVCLVQSCILDLELSSIWRQMVTDRSGMHVCTLSMYFEYALLLTFFQGCLESPGTRHGRKAIMPLGWAGQEGLASALFGMTDPAAAWNGPSLRYRVSVLNCKSIIAHRRALVFCFGVPPLPFRPRPVGAYTTLIHHRASCTASSCIAVTPAPSIRHFHCTASLFLSPVLTSALSLLPCTPSALRQAVPTCPVPSRIYLHATHSLACRRPFLLHPRLTRASPKSDSYTLPLALLALVDKQHTATTPAPLGTPDRELVPVNIAKSGKHHDPLRHGHGQHLRPLSSLIGHPSHNTTPPHSLVRLSACPTSRSFYTVCPGGTTSNGARRSVWGTLPRHGHLYSRRGLRQQGGGICKEGHPHRKVPHAYSRLDDLCSSGSISGPTVHERVGRHHQDPARDSMRCR